MARRGMTRDQADEFIAEHGRGVTAQDLWLDEHADDVLGDLPEPDRRPICSAEEWSPSGEAYETTDRLVCEDCAEAALLSERRQLMEALIQAGLTIRSFPGTDQSSVEFIRAALGSKT